MSKIALPFMPSSTPAGGVPNVGQRSLPPLIQEKEQRPSQIKFVRAAQMCLFADITSWPPLGQVTCLKRSGNGDKVRFTVLLQSSRSLPEQTWEVSIWHNVNNRDRWEALPLRKGSASQMIMLSVGPAPGPDYHTYSFSEELDFPKVGRHASFTVRYRIDANASWQWVNDQFGMKDGELVFEPTHSQLLKDLDPVAQPSKSLTEYLDDLNPDLQIEAHPSESPGAILWSVTGSILSAVGDESTFEEIKFGLPKDFVRYFALVRIWEPWLAPRHGLSKLALTEDSIFLAFLRKDGTHLVLLAISGVDNVLTTFKSGDNGQVVTAVKNDSIHNSTYQVLVAVAPSFEVANSAVMYEARKALGKLSGTGPPSPSIPQELSEPKSPLGNDVVIVENDPQVQWMYDWYDGLAYCTWNALGQDLTEEKILKALDTLKDNGINIVNLIIDDNWQALDNKSESQFKRGWMEFEANKDGFPNGLKHLTSKIRQHYPHIQHIAVWHALMGYWGGISPHGQIAKEYKTKIVKKRDGVAGGSMLTVDPDDIHRFYDDFYKFLLAAGVDSVKTDAQFFLDLLQDPADRVRFTTAYQDAWSVASLRYFQAKAITCMSQTPQIIFHSQVPTNKPKMLLRNSDDFFPNIPSSHPWHVFCNAHNALFTQHLNVIPDWDMFQTSHPYASFHAAARCVSGGPIYITDVPGEHDINVINQMTAPTVGGNTVILRPSVLGRSIDVYHNYNEGKMLRVGAYTGWAKTGSGILGLFNVSAQKTSSMISILDFHGVSPGSEDEYLIRAHSTGRISRIIRPSDQDPLVAISLETKDWEILTAYPVRSFEMPNPLDKDKTTNIEATTTTTSVAVLGLLGKMTGVAAIVSSDIFLVANRRLRFDVTLKALGTLGIYISDIDTRSIEKGFMVMLSGRAVPVHTVQLQPAGAGGQKVVAIDVAAAWKELGLSNGWSNEVVVQVFLS
ncbi:alpha-galactosidase [Histoplasma capsulatum G186AR]|uniref:Alpha-galactosidase n=2 Tax=Ajellomyces capsulatus TaxID=5037 RepID=C0NUM4_AJECG|nr:alpha-galactosidase [Histoplasma capsulatum G186AR]EEH05104.1 alpha-galactosidase [Histoplasma capsulatum G186AR]KAG5287759.1 alpha-galactosidase [Histoplasma capsulatum]QSS70427.1 alpha-galactosidase [Histoplasma capsulatum G186AR]